MRGAGCLGGEDGAPALIGAAVLEATGSVCSRVLKMDVSRLAGTRNARLDLKWLLSLQTADPSMRAQEARFGMTTKNKETRASPKFTSARRFLPYALVGLC